MRLTHLTGFWLGAVDFAEGGGGSSGAGRWRKVLEWRYTSRLKEAM
jgi:hypothetical protein